MGWALLLTVAACGDSGGDGGSGGGDSPALLDQSDACKRYVECTSTVAPSGLGPILDAYGPDGSCWGQDQDLWDTCNDACINGTADYSTQFPDETACWGCVDDSDCGKSKPACDVSQHVCVTEAELPCGGQCTADAPECYTIPSDGAQVCVNDDGLCFATVFPSIGADPHCLDDPACSAIWSAGGPCAGVGQDCSGLQFGTPCYDVWGMGEVPTECVDCGG